MHKRHSIRLQGYDYSLPGTYFVTICTQNKECRFGNVVNGKMILNDTGKMVQMIWHEIPRYYSGVNIDQFQIMPNHIHGIIIIESNPDIVGADPRVCPGIGANPVGADPRVCPGIGANPVGADPRVCPGIGANPVGANPRVCPITQGSVIGQTQGSVIGQTQGSVIGQTQGSAPTAVMATPVGLSMIVQRFKSLTTKRYIDGVKYNDWPPFYIRLWQRNYYEHVIRNEIELVKIRQYIMNNPDKWKNDDCYDICGSG